jgi:hypothetical protein
LSDYLLTPFKFEELFIDVGDHNLHQDESHNDIADHSWKQKPDLVKELLVKASEQDTEVDIDEELRDWLVRIYE